MEMTRVGCKTLALIDVLLAQGAAPDPAPKDGASLATEQASADRQEHVVAENAASPSDAAGLPPTPRAPTEHASDDDDAQRGAWPAGPGA